MPCFTPLPYSAGIMLNAFTSLFCSKFCQQKTLDTGDFIKLIFLLNFIKSMLFINLLSMLIKMNNVMSWDNYRYIKPILNNQFYAHGIFFGTFYMTYCTLLILSLPRKKVYLIIVLSVCTCGHCMMAMAKSNIMVESPNKGHFGTNINSSGLSPV